MTLTHPLLWIFAVVLSIALSVVYAFLPVGDSITMVMAAAAVLLVGIPHGAADHHIYRHLQGGNATRGDMFRFYALYLLAILSVVAGWWIWSGGTLTLFILISAYHFGQGHFHHLEGRTWVYRPLSLVWGLWIILSPIVWHPAAAQPIVAALLQTDITALPWAALASAWWWISALLLGCIGAASRDMSTAGVGRELLTLLALGGLFWYVPLELGFGIYFAIWHAVPSSADQVRFFRLSHPQYPARRYLAVIAPYSLVALAGLAGAWWILGRADIADLWPVVFGGIAALTLPHILLLDRLYAKMCVANAGN